MNLIDVLDMYALIHDSDDLTLMLQDYTLDNRINRDNFNRIIIKELGNMRPYVTDTTVFKFALEEFFDKWNYNIGKLIDTMYYDYDPISNIDTTRTLNENTDRNMSEDELKDKDETESRRKVEDQDIRKVEDEDKVGNEQEHRESTADIDNTDTYTTNVDGSESKSSTDTETVSAYDSSTYQPSKQVTSSMSDTTSNDTTHSGETTSDITSDVDTNKDTTESTDKTTTTSDDKTTTESNTIGTTEDNSKTTEEDISHHLGEKLNGKTADHTYQELVQQERDLAEFNIFNWILKRMREELFLLVY